VGVRGSPISDLPLSKLISADRNRLIHYWNNGDFSMRRVLGERDDHQISSAYPRAVIAYAFVCFLAVLFLIASALLNG
jgi:hypothetical protein